MRGSFNYKDNISSQCQTNNDNLFNYTKLFCKMFRRVISNVIKNEWTLTSSTNLNSTDV